MTISTMNIKYINPLLESTVNVLSTMAMVKVTPGEPCEKQGTIALGDVTGMIDLSEHGKTQGSLAISFPSDVIMGIAENMLGEPAHDLDDSIVDMVGELTNMITGNAKRLYSEQGLEFDLTLPHTTIGTQNPTHSVDGKPIVLPFSTDLGEFYVEMCFKEH